jgi:O-antigen ligase
MSTHNVVLQYLSETGIVGLGALLWLAYSGLQTARQNFRLIRDRGNAGTAAAAMAMMVLFVLTIFFMRAWTWAQGGYLLAFIFSLVAVLHHDRLESRPEKPS